MKTAITAIMLILGICAAAGAQVEPPASDITGPKAEESTEAEVAAAAQLTLADVLAEVRTKNPDLQAAKAVSLAYKNRIKQAYILKDPVIEFERMYTPSGKSFFNDAGERNISISQEIDNP